MTGSAMEQSVVEDGDSAGGWMGPVYLLNMKRRVEGI
jgi:hypothetical protein